MVQLNLLPAVKLEFIKARRTKQLLTLVSFAVGVVSLVIFLLTFVTVNVVQKKSLSDLNKDISKYSAQLKSTPELDKILTVQNQLGTLTSLHDQKPVASRLFSYISQVTPSQASLDKLTVDFAAHTMNIGGTAPSLDVVSTYTDTLKATKYSSGTDQPQKAFSDVVLSSFGRDDKGATFSITFSFDPPIFDTKNDVKLTVPNNTDANQSSIFGVGK